MKLTRAIIVTLILSMVAGLGGCTVESPPPPPTPEPATAPAPTPWSPNQDKLLVVPREYLTREGGFIINVPPADLVIIPVSVGEYEHLAGWGWSAKGATEDYIDSWLVNSDGSVISKSGRSFNYSCSYAYGNNPGLSSGTYYIYLSNEFTSASDKQVSLHVRWQ